MDKATESRTTRARWRAQHRCGGCGKKLGESYEFLTCEPCRERCKMVHRARKEAAKEVFAALPQPELLELPDLAKCQVCGLRGSHVCLKGSAADRRAWP